MMKNVLCVLFLAVLAVFAACSSAPPAAQSPAVNPATVIQRENQTIDWRGANLGGQIPDWVRWTAEGDPDNQIADLPRLKGKKVVQVENKGKDLDVLQAWANIEGLGDAAQSIKTSVEREGASMLEGTKNTLGNKNMVNTFTTVFTQADISGLSRELDFWVKERSPTGEEQYTYYMVFGIAEENFDYLVEQALGKVQAKNTEEQEMVDELRNRMRNLRFKVTGE
jgi:hypothetical protein